MEVRNGIVARTRSELPESWIAEGHYRPHSGPDMVERWFYISPFNADPWDEFYGKPLRRPLLPAGFSEIFGPEPAGVSELTFWQQQLGLFSRQELPASVSPAQAADVEAKWRHYLLGTTPVCWLTTRGDYIVTPVGRSELSQESFGLDIYTYAQLPIAACQIILIGRKVLLPNGLVPFLSNVNISHKG